MKIECDQKGGVKMEESHNFYLNDYTEFVKQATDIIESKIGRASCRERV